MESKVTILSLKVHLFLVIGELGD